jgi:hypothetical protein
MHGPLHFCPYALHLTHDWGRIRYMVSTFHGDEIGTMEMHYI